MREFKSKRPGVNRREFVTGAAAAATLAGLPWNAMAEGVPMEFDGSKFQLAAPEPNPKRGGVLKYGITMRPPHFDFHQSGTINSLGSQGCMFDNLIRRDPRDSGKTIIPDLAHSWEISKDGKTYTLAANDNGNSLHGGLKGFDKRLWEAQTFRDSGQAGVRLHLVSPDGDEGYPGRLDVVVTYALTDSNELRITYLATSDQPTVLNLSHHGYWNLGGHASGDILGHELMLAADSFTPVDTTLIPTGEVRSVAGTPLDFRSPALIGARIGQDDQQLRFGKGYDHNWVVDGPAGTLRLAARVRDPKSGRVDRNLPLPSDLLGAAVDLVPFFDAVGERVAVAFDSASPTTVPPGIVVLDGATGAALSRYTAVSAAMDRVWAFQRDELSGRFVLANRRDWAGAQRLGRSAIFLPRPLQRHLVALL